MSPARDQRTSSSGCASPQSKSASAAVATPWSTSARAASSSGPSVARRDGCARFAASVADHAGDDGLVAPVVEELFFDDVSTGPGGDLAYATGIAAQMVGQAGMAGTLVSFSAVQGSSLADPG